MLLVYKPPRRMLKNDNQLFLLLQKISQVLLCNMRFCTFILLQMFLFEALAYLVVLVHAHTLAKCSPWLSGTRPTAEVFKGRKCLFSDSQRPVK